MARHLKISSSIGERIARLRADRRMTLDALARATGFTKSYLSKIENARKVPPIGSLSRIAVALDSDIAGFNQIAYDVPLWLAESSATTKGGASIPMARPAILTDRSTGTLMPAP